MLDGAARIIPAHAASLRIDAGRQRDFSSAANATSLRVDAGRQRHFSSAANAGPVALETGATAWTRGMLLADGMRLGAFVAELARYRSGPVRVEPDIAALPVSGVFPVADTGRTPAMLTAA